MASTDLPTPFTRPSAEAACSADRLHSTCLQWSADGELMPVDLRPVLETLARVDANLTAELRRA